MTVDANGTVVAGVDLVLTTGDGARPAIAAVAAAAAPSASAGPSASRSTSAGVAASAGMAASAGVAASADELVVESDTAARAVRVSVDPSTLFAAQAGAFMSVANARSHARVFTALGYPSRIEAYTDANHVRWYRVRVGNIAPLSRALAQAQQMQAAAPREQILLLPQECPHPARVAGVPEETL